MSRFISLFAAAALGAVVSLQAAASSTSAEREDAVTITAQVRAIDYATREVLLRGENGNHVELVASPEVRNLDQVKIGDVLIISYYEAVAAHIADADSGSSPTGAVAVERATKGDKPGMAAASVVNMVVEFIGYDSESHTATFTTSDGAMGSVVVHPKMREFAANLKKDDRVDVTVTRAVAIAMATPSK